ncbi:Uncharacterised protein [Mycobacteroides abscessus subsp. abscessus]|nr:Uncharacterised protein [Mycobacteroides abscessus subsp. abscessus]
MQSTLGGTHRQAAAQGASQLQRLHHILQTAPGLTQDIGVVDRYPVKFDTGYVRTADAVSELLGEVPIGRCRSPCGQCRLVDQYEIESAGSAGHGSSGDGHYRAATGGVVDKPLRPRERPILYGDVSGEQVRAVLALGETPADRHSRPNQLGEAGALLASRANPGRRSAEKSLGVGDRQRHTAASQNANELRYLKIIGQTAAVGHRHVVLGDAKTVKDRDGAGGKRVVPVLCRQHCETSRVVRVAGIAQRGLDRVDNVEASRCHERDRCRHRTTSPPAEASRGSANAVIRPPS